MYLSFLTKTISLFLQEPISKPPLDMSYLYRLLGYNKCSIGTFLHMCGMVYHVTSLCSSGLVALIAHAAIPWLRRSSLVSCDRDVSVVADVALT
jgi:hypothetical protein